MQFIALLPIVFAAAANAITVTRDTTYDDGSYSLYNTACSDGPNGLVTATRTMLNQFPSYPYVGGSQYVEDWNSNQCGSCYQLSYNGNSIYLVAVDSADDGFTTSSYAYNQLVTGQTGDYSNYDNYDSYGNYGNYDNYGEIDAEVTQVDAHHCGL
ncbi:unnamed protein product [Peniophora sp. CBMAI 1063]|nr:unnamed protein product [Peniophora sp. CBMAI 1063]